MPDQVRHDDEGHDVGWEVFVEAGIHQRPLLPSAPISHKGAPLTHMDPATYRCRFAVTGVQRINRKGTYLWRHLSSLCTN